MLILSVLLFALICFKTIILSETILAIIVLCQIIPLLLSGLMVENKIKKL